MAHLFLRILSAWVVDATTRSLGIGADGRYFIEYKSPRTKKEFLLFILMFFPVLPFMGEKERTGKYSPSTKDRDSMQAILNFL